MHYQALFKHAYALVNNKEGWKAASDRLSSEQPEQNFSTRSLSDQKYDKSITHGRGRTSVPI